MRRIRRVLLAFTKEVSRLSCGTVAQQSHGVQLALRHPASWANAALMTEQNDAPAEHPERVMRWQRERTGERALCGSGSRCQRQVDTALAGFTDGSHVGLAHP